MNGKNSGIIVILCIMCLVGIFSQKYFPCIHDDEVLYLQMAERFREMDIKKAFGIYHPPLFPAFIAFFSIFLPFDIVTTARLTSLFFYIALIFFFYLFCRKLFSEKIALVSAFFLAFHHRMFTLSLHILGIIPSVLFLFLGLWSALRESKKAGKNFFLVGLLLSFASLCRPENFSAFLFVVCWLFGLFIVKKYSFKSFFTSFFLLLVGFFLLYFPYILYIYTQLGVWKLSVKAEHYFVSQNVEDREKFLYKIRDSNTVAQFWYSNEPKDYIRTDPSSFLTGREIFRNCLRNYITLYEENLAYAFTAFLIFLVGASIKRKFVPYRNFEEIFFLSFILFMISLTLFFRFSDRRVPFLLPFFCIWASIGAFELTHSLKFRNLFLCVLLIIIGFTHLFLFVKEMRIEDFDLPVELKRAGLWMKKHVGKGCRVMSREKVSLYYAEAVPVAMPHESIEKIIDYGIKKGVDYIVVSDYIIRKRPQLLPLLEGNKFALPCIYKSTASIKKYGRIRSARVAIFKLQ